MNTFKVTEKKLRNLVGRKQFAEHGSDEDDQHYVSTDVRYGSPCNDLGEDRNLRTEGIGKFFIPTTENFIKFTPIIVPDISRCLW